LRCLTRFSENLWFKAYAQRKKQGIEQEKV
jgi:hypothetical protein